MEHLEEVMEYRVDAWVVRLMHRYSSMNFNKFKELGLHPGQLPVMRLLQEHEGISLREMAEGLHIKPPTATVTVKRLEKAGMVCKRNDSEDMRVTRIYLTEKGKSITSEIHELMEENERILTEGFSRKEILQLCGFFRRMTENVARVYGKEGSCCSGLEEFPPPL